MPELETGAAPAAAPDVTASAVIDTNPPPAGETNAAPPVEEKQPSIDDTLAAAWDKAQTGVERGEDGKFQSDKPPAEAAPPEPTTESVVQPPTEAIEPAPVQAIDPPQSWTTEARAHWAKLPPEAQNYILQRESEAHKAITSYGDRLKSYEPLEKVITQYRADFERRGLDPARATATLFEAQRMLDSDPINGLISIGLGYGIDLRPLLAGQQGALPAPDPRVGQVAQEVSQIKQTLQQQLDAIAQQQAAAAAAMVQEFAKDKPYFAEVRRTMASLMQATDENGNPTYPDLQSAYDAAVRAHPAVAKRIEADQRKAAEEKRKADEAKQQEELKKRAEEAAKQAKLNVKSGTAHPTPKSMEDTIEELGRRLYG